MRKNVVVLLQLATKMSEIVLDWVDEGLDVNRFHVIGHGIGGQMAGMIGRCAHRKSDGETKLTRITALDPPAAFPLGARINEKDAEFVDIIFTDAWFYSTPKRSGTVNFWPSFPQRKSKVSDGKLMSFELNKIFNNRVCFGRTTRLANVGGNS